MNVYIEGLTIQGVNTGIHISESSLADTYIASNKMACTRQGIFISNIEPYNKFNIRSNIISVSSNQNILPTNLTGGIIINGGLGANVVQGNIYNNTINIFNAQFGMHMQNAEGFIVNENTVILHSTTIKQEGILSIGNSNYRIQCNTVNGVSVQPIGNSYPRAIDLRDSFGSNHLNFNHTNDTYRGVMYIGANPIFMKGHDFQFHRQGLFYANGAGGIPQFLEGNTWINEYGSVNNMYGAITRNNTPSWFDLNRYTISSWAAINNVPNLPTSGLPFNPGKIRIINNAGTAWNNYGPGTTNTITSQEWFVPNPALSDSTMDGDDCWQMQGIVINESEETQLLQQLEQTFESDNYTGTYYSSLQNWQHDRIHLDMITKNPQLLNSTSISNWYSQMQNSSAIQYNATACAIHNALRLSTADSAFLQTLRQQIRTTDSLLYICDTIISSSTIDTNVIISAKISKATYMANLNALYSQYNLWLQGIRTDESRIDSAALKVDALVDSALYELNERTIKQIYLSTVARSIFTFTAEDEFIIYSIASQCPALGGNAVYAARSLYSLLNDSLQFDDDFICSAAGLREEEDIVDEVDVVKSFELYPNPNSGNFNIKWEIIRDRVWTICVFDVMGREIYCEQVTSEKGMHLMSLNKISGLYRLVILDKGMQIFSKNISVVR